MVLSELSVAYNFPAYVPACLSVELREKSTLDVQSSGRLSPFASYSKCPLRRIFVAAGVGVYEPGGTVAVGNIGGRVAVGIRIDGVGDGTRMVGVGRLAARGAVDVRVDAAMTRNGTKIAAMSTKAIPSA